MATGCLGWPPAVAWSTPIPEILCAYKARIEWVQATNPFGKPAAKPQMSEEDKQKQAQRLVQLAALRAKAHGAKQQ